MDARRLRAPLSVLVLFQAAPGQGTSSVRPLQNLRSQCLSTLRGGDGSGESRGVESSARRRRRSAASGEMPPAPDSGGGRGAGVDAIGGGAINDKPRTYVAPNHDIASPSTSVLLPTSIWAHPASTNR